MNNLSVPLGLIAIGVVLLALEAFVPSAGVLGALAATAQLAGVVSAFWYGGMAVGTTFMIGTSVSVGFLINFMIRKWPDTLFGRLVLVEPPPPEELLPDRSDLHATVGRIGRALSLMLPSGFVEIDGKRYDASAEATIEEGAWIEVVAVRNGSNLIVRAIKEEAAIKAEKEKELADNPMAMPVSESLSDPFDDTLG